MLNKKVFQNLNFSRFLDISLRILEINEIGTKTFVRSFYFHYISQSIFAGEKPVAPRHSWWNKGIKLYANC